MKRVSAFLFATTLGLAGCNEVSVEPLREGLRRLNDLEDRAFAMAQIDGAGRFVVVTPIQELQAVAAETRSAALLGCLGKARDAWWLPLTKSSWPRRSAVVMPSWRRLGNGRPPTEKPLRFA